MARIAVPGWEVLRCLIGSLLLFAAGGKLWALDSPGPSSPATWGGVDWFSVILIQAEVVLALALFLNLAPRLTWGVALVSFAGFAIASLYSALQGQNDCGCFGAVRVNPWFTYALDVTVLVALLFARPPRQASSSPWSRRWVVTIAVAGAMCLIAPVAASLARSRPLSLSHDFGVVFAGQVVKHRFHFTNMGDQTLQLVGESAVAKSCGCTSVDVEPREIAPGKSAIVQVAVRTDRKQGDFSETASLKWSEWGTSNAIAPVHYRLQGKAVKGIAANPASVLFTANTLGHQAHSVLLTSELPVDWKSFEVESTIGPFQVVSTEAAEGGLRLKLNVDPQADLREFREGHVSGRVPVTQEHRQDLGEFFFVTIPLFADPIARLSASPDRVALQFDQQTGQATARLLLRLGTKGATLSTVEGNAAAAFAVIFTAKTLDPKTLLVDLAFELKDRGQLPESPLVNLRLDSGEELAVPVSMDTANTGESNAKQ